MKDDELIQYEYRLVIFDRIIEEKIKQNPDAYGGKGKEYALVDALNDLGKEGWDVYAINGDCFAKRPLNA